MPICQPCLDAASGADWGPIPVCSECGQGPICVYNDEVPLEQQSVVFHKHPVPDPDKPQYRIMERCPGTKKPPYEQTGHDFCDGCPCQHRPPGSWKGKQ